MQDHAYGKAVLLYTFTIVPQIQHPGFWNKAFAN